MPENSSASKYLKTFIVGLSALILITTLINIYIDPKGYIHHLNLPSANLIKIYQTSSRQEKASKLVTGKYDALVLGTSRVIVGINPKHPTLSGYQAYNMGLASINVFELKKVFNFAARHNKVKLVVYGLDFMSFSNSRSVREDYRKSLFSGKSQRYLVPYLASTSTFADSMNTIRKNISGNIEDYSDENGFLDKTGKTINHRKMFIEVLSKNFFIRDDAYATFKYAKDRLKMFQEILEKCAENKIELKMFISPVHARQLEAIKAMGLFDQFVEWKRDLVNTIEKINKKYSVSYSIWDFSGYNSITTENVPEVEEASNEMKWYWESSHYKKELGDMIMGTIFNRYVSKNAGNDDFGVEINTKNINKHLTEMNKSRKEYCVNNFQEIKEVEKLAKQTEKKRLLLLDKFPNINKAVELLC